MFVDTHTHFYDEWLLPDAEEAIGRAVKAGVGKMLQADIDSRERPRMWAIGQKHKDVIYQMLGLYPGSVGADWRDELDKVFEIAAGDARSVPDITKEEQGRTEVGLPLVPIPRFVAIGEIGLDYHEGKEYAKEQKVVLREQLELAAKMGLPVNIHLRDAWEDFFKVLKDCKHLKLRGNLHCFSGSYELYQRANQHGVFAVGIGGVITFRNSALAATVARIPMEHILLETDAPYLAPVPHRGERNESAYLPIIAARVAEAKGMTVQQIEQLTTENAEKLFGI